MGEICAQLLVSFEKINSQYDKIRIDNAELASDNLYQGNHQTVSRLDLKIFKRRLIRLNCESWRKK